MTVVLAWLYLALGGAYTVAYFVVRRRYDYAAEPGWTFWPRSAEALVGTALALWTVWP